MFQHVDEAISTKCDLRISHATTSVDITMNTIKSLYKYCLWPWPFILQNRNYFSHIKCYDFMIRLIRRTAYARDTFANCGWWAKLHHLPLANANGNGGNYWHRRLCNIIKIYLQIMQNVRWRPISPRSIICLPSFEYICMFADAITMRKRIHFSFAYICFACCGRREKCASYFFHRST